MRDDNALLVTGKLPPDPESGCIEIGEGSDEDEQSWRKKLVTNNHGWPKAVLPNAMRFIRHRLKGCLRYDERGLAPTWTSPPPWNNKLNRKLQDEDAAHCVEWFTDKEGVIFSEKMMLSALVAESKKLSFDRVREYLDPLEWDRKPRLNTWLFDYFGAKTSTEADKEYVKSVGVSWLISAVARAMDPGSKVDHMIVLEAAQGHLKSSSLAALGGEFYSEIVVDVGSKDSLMAIHGPLIIEWGELAGLTRREAEAVKAFLSRTVDRFRLPYNRLVSDQPRRCVFAGTTNDGTYLNDATGNRRYWPVEVRRGDPDAIARDRDQLWAEAVHRYQEGEQWWLTSDLEAIARRHQEDRLEADIWESSIEFAIDRGRLQGRDFITTAELVKFSDSRLQPRRQGSAVASDGS